jgi:multiple antibiotic resistance protein
MTSPDNLLEFALLAASSLFAITPLGVPMLAGPGAITTVILLHNQAKGIVQQITLYVCILAVSALCYLILRWSAQGAR